MRFSWFKRDHASSDQVLYNKTLTELMEARRAQPPTQHTLAEFIQVGNRDVGLGDEAEPGPIANTEPGDEASASDESPAPAEPVVEEPLSELSMEELARLISASDPDTKP
jgi:hypothetical protein